MLSKSQIKYIQSLGHKKFRDETGLFIAEGPKIVNELLTEIPQLVKTVYGIKEWLDESRSLLGKSEFIEINETELERISQLSTPNKVLAVLHKMNYDKIVSANNITLVLDTIQDPGNLGTIIRSADWFGVKQIVCSHNSADMYSSKVIQATMGSIARVKIIYTDLEEWLEQQKVTIFAAALEGKDIRKMNRLTEGIIVIGNESKGIHPDVMQLAVEKITIPKPGRAESLNAAVATAIILSHIV
ncbi:MAG: methyltransferase [Chitinophagaceae bacterium]|nr:methyltransferase [Chitinophagaceae bacterium]